MEKYSKKEKLLLKVAFGMQKAMKIEVKIIDRVMEKLDQRRNKLWSVRWDLTHAINEIDEYR